MEGATCLACHQLDQPSIGPSYVAVAQKYEGDPEATQHLVKNIREGGSGVWGEMIMPPHPQFSESEAQQMVAYILSLAEEPPLLPVEGTYMPPAVEAGGTTQGIVVLRASYTDRGANGLPGASAEKTLVLRATTVLASDGELAEGVMRIAVPQFPTPMAIVSQPGSYIRFEQLDLTGISQVRLFALAPRQFQAQGGKVEIRLDAPDGPLLGETDFIEDVANPMPFPVAIEPTAGTRDVYFTFKNDEHDGQGMLFVLTTVEFAGAGENVKQQIEEQSASAGLDTHSPIRELLANEQAKAVLDKHVPGMTTNPQLEQAMDMSLRQIAPFAPQTFTEQLLEAIDEDLAEL